MSVRQALAGPIDPACFAAFVRLLARPDPPDLRRRASILKYGGDPHRRATLLPWMAAPSRPTRPLAPDQIGEMEARHA